MIKQNQTKLNIIHIVNDALCSAASIFISYYITLNIFNHNLFNYLPEHSYTTMILVTAVIVLQILSNFIFDLYRSYRSSRFIVEITNILKSGITAFIIFMWVAFSSSTLFVFQIPIILYFFLYTIINIIYRFILRKSLHFFRTKGYNKKYIVLIGINDCTDDIIDIIKSSPYLGYEILGYFDIVPHSQLQLKYIGNFKKLSQYLAEYRPDEALIMLSDKAQSYAPHIISICENWGLKFSLVPNIFASFSSRVFISNFNGIPVFNLRKVPLDNKFNAFVKRMMDIIIASLMLIAASPIMIMTAVIIKSTSPGPVIFRQERVGVGRKEFTMYKFRSMRTETQDDISMTEENDSRCTKFGLFIRKTSIDELPQLINVLKGNMSLVGPRPEIPYYVEHFRKLIPQYMVKHYVKPGMTGWAQVNDLRGGDTSIEERIKHDIYYIEHWSPVFDIKILFKTLLKCFSSKNAR